LIKETIAPEKEKRRNAAYDRIASEYYDSKRHPTCSNFFEASRSFISKHLYHTVQGSRLDIGAGDSVICSLLSAWGCPLESVIAVDNSLGMLNYSRKYAVQGATLTVACATEIPLRTHGVTEIVGSLGDPYNNSSFWKEVKRCLGPRGQCLFTTPSHEWAEIFRKKSPLERDGAAYFELRNGTSIYVPSFIYTIEEQVEMIERNGLRVDSVESVPTSTISEPLSPKLITAAGMVESLITGFRIVHC